LEISFLDVDDFVSENLSNCLLRSESVFSGSLSYQVDGLIDSSHWRNVDCLLSYNTSSTNSSWILSGSGIDNSIDEYFKRVSSSEEIDDFEDVSNNSNGFNFLSCVSTVELKWANKSFNNGAKCLSEFFGLISSSSVWNEYLCFGGFGCDVINEAWIFNLCKCVVLLWCHHRTTWRRVWAHFRSQL